MNISALHIWNQWHSFWESKNHVVIDPHSIIADKNDTAIFTIAGMQQFIPYLSGQQHPLGNRLADIQHCVRTNDIDIIGDDTHHTMFFMMGNRSLGDYFKQDAIKRSFEFLTDKKKGLGLDPHMLAVTAFEGDDEVERDNETANIRKETGISSERISFLSAKDNRRSPGPVGPCGPCTEMYYRIGEGEPYGNVKDNEDDWMEIWNNVFMEFYRDETGLRKLEKQNVDTGMGFERLLRILNNAKSTYETELFFPIIKTIETLTKQTYNDNKQSMRVIADHIRCATFLIAEGVMPSNEGRGYVLRRIIRRSYFHIHKILGNHNINDIIDILLLELANTIIYEYSKFTHISKFLTGKEKLCAKILIKESQQFARTLQSGKAFLHKILSQKSSDKILSGEELFMLYDTHGFPLDITREIATSQGFKLDEIAYEKAMEEAKLRSRNNTLDSHKKIDRSIHTAGIDSTQFTGYDELESNDIQVLKIIEFSDYDVIIFDKTPCYATMGGQDHDNGTWIDEDNNHHEIFDVQNYNGVFLHFVKR